MRIGLFFEVVSLAGAFSGLLAYAIGFMSGMQGLLGWSWIFILEGIYTVAVGLLAFFVRVSLGRLPCDCLILNPRRARLHCF